jgi:hypothetical protein
MNKSQRTIKAERDKLFSQVMKRIGALKALRANRLKAKSNLDRLAIDVLVKKKGKELIPICGKMHNLTVALEYCEEKQ